MKIPAISLKVDVDVDTDHVATLVENIKENGQLAPVVVRKVSHDIVDGFHRVAAMQELGMDVEIIEHKFTDDEAFLAARIVSATQHEGVKVARAVVWIDQEWSRLPIAKLHKSAKAAFGAYKNKKASDEAIEWVEKAARRWGVSPMTIVNNWMGSGGKVSEVSHEVETIVDEDQESEAETPTTHSTKKKDRDVNDPESMNVRFRNAWAEVKICEHELSKVTDEDMDTAPDEHKRMLLAVLSPLGDEVDRIYKHIARG